MPLTRSSTLLLSTALMFISHSSSTSLDQTLSPASNLDLEDLVLQFQASRHLKLNKRRREDPFMAGLTIEELALEFARIQKVTLSS